MEEITQSDLAITKEGFAEIKREHKNGSVPHCLFILDQLAEAIVNDEFDISGFTIDGHDASGMVATAIESVVEWYGDVESDPVDEVFMQLALLNLFREVSPST